MSTQTLGQQAEAGATAYEHHQALAKERREKLDAFVNEAQDGHKMLISHRIDVKFIELIDVSDLELEFASSQAVSAENTRKIKERQSNLIEQIAGFVNSFGSSEVFVNTDISYYSEPLTAPPPMPIGLDTEND